jgi:hypothetical protein
MKESNRRNGCYLQNTGIADTFEADVISAAPYEAVFPRNGEGGILFALFSQILMYQAVSP